MDRLRCQKRRLHVDATETQLPSCIPGRPLGANGTFLRIITINDVYKIDNYPYVASAVKMARVVAEALDCVVIATLNGDFLSPSVFTTLDGGRVLVDALNEACVDYVCLGNHEFDLGLPRLKQMLRRFKGTVINSLSLIHI